MFIWVGCKVVIFDKEEMKKIVLNEVNFFNCKLVFVDCVVILYLFKNVDEKFGLILCVNYLGDLGCMEI